jgi:ABC-2 type transport system permease protein
VVDRSTALTKIERHQLDMLVDPTAGGATGSMRNRPKAMCWNGCCAERPTVTPFNKQTVSGRAIRYVDWVMPGVLAMNMMFSCLFGVGYVIVRYRKNGMLKRLKATPLNIHWNF